MKTWECSAIGCTWQTIATRWPDAGCGAGHDQSHWSLIDPGPAVPKLRLFVDGIGDNGLSLRFMLRWNGWRIRTYGYSQPGTLGSHR